MYKAKKEFLWFKKGQDIEEVQENWLKEDLVEEVGSKPVKGKKNEEENFDFNGDGKVDKKDVKLAAKLMGKVRAKKSRKKKFKR